jgi:hypothetical protein
VGLAAPPASLRTNPRPQPGKPLIWISGWGRGSRGGVFARAKTHSLKMRIAKGWCNGMLMLMLECFPGGL